MSDSIAAFDGRFIVPDSTCAQGEAKANLSDDATDIEFGPGGDLYVALRNRGAIVRVNGVTGDVLGDFTSGGQWTSSHFLLFTHPVPEPGTVLTLMSGLISWMLGGRSIRQFPRR